MSEYEYKEEEYYVVAALPDDALKNAYSTSNKASGESESLQPHYSIVDIESDRPLLELEGAIFQGTNDELLGTGLFFDSGPVDSADPAKPSADLVAKTSRVIIFRPVAISRK
ncbi:hypothetical protein GGI21_003673 [Coemansia aciculifera]|uniref:Uncharacterized protein n=1 Tax=Coemansia aciculifera TaxID=417176 RepID=A0ACC1M716_9FUNG|nr:hypothetical protein IWW38_001029 [Coemansia aciculifera]KAJ2907655.1 hypothetical protein GGI21_003673 [Coemansia aciculifera]